MNMVAERFHQSEAIIVLDKGCRSWSSESMSSELVVGSPLQVESPKHIRREKEIREDEVSR